MLICFVSRLGVCGRAPFCIYNELSSIDSILFCFERLPLDLPAKLDH